MDSFVAVLKEANMTPDDLVSVTVYCTDLSQYQKFNSVYRTYFKKDFPARAFIGAGSLLFGAKFEIQGIAIRR
jgi:2-iminobutanoate/2-iminopropanoate deaminase